jgi:hypothetical protein
MITNKNYLIGVAILGIFLGWVLHSIFFNRTYSGKLELKDDKKCCQPIEQLPKKITDDIEHATDESGQLRWASGNSLKALLLRERDRGKKEAVKNLSLITPEEHAELTRMIIEESAILPTFVCYLQDGLLTHEEFKSLQDLYRVARPAKSMNIKPDMIQKY